MKRFSDREANRKISWQHNAATNRALLIMSFAMFGAVLLFQSSAQAACPDAANNAGYVRAGATGTGSGADWTNADPNLPAGLIRGCTYYVAAGSYPSYTFSTADSGTTPIVVQAATTTAHGTSTGWSPSYGVDISGSATFACSTSCGKVIGFGSDYWVFNGAYRTNWTSGYGFHVSNTNGVAQATIGDVGNVHDITIAYSEIEGSHPTSDSSPGVGSYLIEFANEDSGGTFYDILIDHDYVHDGYTAFYLKGTGTSSSTNANNVTIQYSYAMHTYSSSTYHGELCACSQGLKNFAIRYSYWVDSSTHANGTAVIATPSGGGYQSGNQNNGPWYIYGNLIGVVNGTAGEGDATLDWFDVSFNPGGDLWIVNNTYFDLGFQPYASGYAWGSGWHAQMSGVYVENEVWYNSKNWGFGANGGTFTYTTFTHDYNQYYQMVDSGFSGDGGSNSVITSSSNPFVNAAAFNFQLATDTSPGVTLSNVGTYWNGTAAVANTFNLDMNGTTRGVNGTWDRGAFQYSATSSAPSPPTGLTVISAQ
jgi:hypothetical protein